VARASVPPAGQRLEAIPAHAAAVVGRLVPNAFGVACGTVVALLLFGFTIAPAVRPQPALTDQIGLLSEYFYGFRVSVIGSCLMAAYGFGIGYVLGQLFARFRNFGVIIYLLFLWRRAEHDAASDLLDHL